MERGRRWFERNEDVGHVTDKSRFSRYNYWKGFIQPVYLLEGILLPTKMLINLTISTLLQKDDESKQNEILFREYKMQSVQLWQSENKMQLGQSSGACLCDIEGYRKDDKRQEGKPVNHASISRCGCNVEMETSVM